MRLFKITNGFDEQTDAYLLVRANTIKNAIAANPTAFNSPVPTLSELGSLISAFQASVLKAEGGNKQDIAVKNADRQAVIDALHLLGNYVLFMAGGNEVIATSSGFNISKVPTARPALAAPEGLVLSNGVNKGELKLRFKRVAGATAYKYEITPSPVTENSVWESSLGTASKRVFAELEPGKEYNCRIAAVGVKDQVVYSDIVSHWAA